MLKRAHSLIEFKAVDAEERILEGIATTPSPDRADDIVEPEGAVFKLPLPFMWQHGQDPFVGKTPVGHLIAAKPTKNGIPVRIQMERTDKPGRLKEILDFAWDAVSSKLVRGLSIGFAPIESTDIEGTWGRRFVKWDWLELSAVTIPMNADASIAVIRSCDLLPVVSGTSNRNSPVVSGRSRVALTTRAGTSMATKTIAERILQMKAAKDAKAQRMTELLSKDDGHTTDEAEAQEFDTLRDEVGTIDKDLARLEALEQINRSSVVTVRGGDGDESSASRGGQSVETHSNRIVSVSSRRDKGIGFTRYAMCLASANGNRSEALEIAKARYPDDHDIHTILKAAVAAGTTTDATWAGNLVQYQNITTDFIDFLRAKTIVDRFGQNGVPSLNRVSPRVRFFSQTAGGSAYWVGEGKPKPVTKAGFGTLTIDNHKVATIAVLTEEEVRLSSPSAEAKVRNDLANAVAARIDQDFIDPSKAAVAGVSPASITNGVAAIAPTGTNWDDFRLDMGTALNSFATNLIDPSSLVIIMSASQALQLSLMLGTLGNPVFPDLRPNGGTLMGYPVLVSQYLQSLGSPGTGLIVFVSADDIFLADDGQVVIDVSREASLEMLDGSLQQDATAGTPASAGMVSLWQVNCIGIRAERFITWKARRSAAVAYISPAAYVLQ